MGTLAAVEPLRSRTVLQILDGPRGIWHGGPFAHSRRYVFYPRQILFGTDPVAMDRRRDLDLGPFAPVPEGGRHGQA